MENHAKTLLEKLNLDHSLKASIPILEELVSLIGHHIYSGESQPNARLKWFFFNTMKTLNKLEEVSLASSEDEYATRSLMFGRMMVMAYVVCLDDWLKGDELKFRDVEAIFGEWEEGRSWY